MTAEENDIMPEAYYFLQDHADPPAMEVWNIHNAFICCFFCFKAIL